MLSLLFCCVSFVFFAWPGAHPDLRARTHSFPTRLSSHLFLALTLDLSKANSLAEAQAMIASYAQANPGRRWIIGAGWNQERWGMNRFPTAADIDAILHDPAVWLERADGHAGWANRQAMTMAGIR